MNEPTVAERPSCVECGAVWLPADDERWQLHQVDIDELAWYCPECAAREFGPDDSKQGGTNGRARPYGRWCVRCRSRQRRQVPHRIPLRDGGSSALTNFELLCARCHRLCS